jgi:hypothetical protein
MNICVLIMVTTRSSSLGMIFAQAITGARCGYADYSTSLEGRWSSHGGSSTVHLGLSSMQGRPLYACQMPSAVNRANLAHVVTDCP